MLKFDDKGHLMPYEVIELLSKFILIMTTIQKEQLSKITALVREIEEADKMEKKFMGSDVVHETMRFQFQFKKNKLVKELLALLIYSDFGIQLFNDFFTKAIGWLAKVTPQKNIDNPKEIQESLKVLERVLV